MNANLYRHELRQKARSVGQWGLGLALVHFLYLPFFPTFAKEQALIDAFMRQLPREYLAAFGFAGSVSYATVLGFYSLVFLFVQMILAVQASRYGFDLLTLEERYGTADFLLTRPLSRAQVFGSKLAAALSALALTWVIVWASAWSSIALFRGGHPYDAGTLALVLSSVIPFQLYFLGVGAALSLMMRRVRHSTPYALGLGFGLYALGAFSEAQGNAVSDALGWLSPFKGFRPTDLVAHRAYDAVALLLAVGLALLGLLLAWLLFRRRDIAATL